MTLQEFENGLKGACAETYELKAPKGGLRCVVWNRYGRNYGYGDDRNQIEGIKIQIDVFTNVNHDTLPDDVCAALWMMDLPYSVESEGYDHEYNQYRMILQTVVV